MKDRMHRAREAMLALGREIPGVWDEYDAMRLRREASDPAVFVTEQDGAEAFTRALLDARGEPAMEELRRMGPLQVARIVSPATTLATWRMTQGIYRFDPTLYESLISTPLTGELPAEVLAHLPEWCMYIETPGLHVLRVDGGKAALAGAWARSDRETDGTRCIIFTLDIPEATYPESHTIVLRGDLETSVSETMRQWGFDRPEIIEGVAGYIRPLVNLLLYLIGSDDIAGPGQPGNPQPKRTRRGGTRLFAVPGPRQWEVGVRMGAALRHAYAEASASQGGTHAGPRPHIRRAHWHSYWIGPLESPDRRLKPRWLPPIPVNLEAVGDLPATIRRV